MGQICEFYLSDVNSAVKESRYAEKDINLTECLNRHANSMSQMYDSLQKVLSFINDIVLPYAENIAREEMKHIPDEDLLKLHARLCVSEFKKQYRSDKLVF